jgi:hypothetical protein
MAAKKALTKLELTRPEWSLWYVGWEVRLAGLRLNNFTLP